jgi:uncharacterized protein YjbI with pentapeptide repeats
VGQTKPEREQKEETKQSRWGFRGKTVWDWMALLIVPLVLVVIGLVFTMLQDARQQQIEDKRAQQAQKIENQRAEAERELAEQRAQDEALQAYLDQMSQLMLERKLLDAGQGDPVHTLAQARTSTAILRLDAQHNESVTRFLTDSGLATSSESSATLLSEIALSHATLSNAHLPNADLSDADLSSANLTDANLFSANLSGADLNEADLNEADLNEADLSFALLINADLIGADLISAPLDGADLSAASLSETDLSEADLSHAYMPKTDLSDADLNDAILRDADLSGAKGITNEELKQQATTLEGATMPNGQKYEDWLKDREGRKNE